MSDYTPTDATAIQLSYIDGRKSPFEGGIWTPEHEREYQRYKGEFDRWLAEHDRQVAAAAWDEAIDETEGCGWIFDYVVTEMYARNPYKEKP